MHYELKKDEILELVKMAYEQGSSGYSDLKESACEKIVANFLADKKRITPITNLNLQTSVSSDTGTNLTQGVLFGSDVYTIAGGYNPNI